jgi:hypothetical protein
MEMKTNSYTASLIRQVERERLRQDLFYLAQDPLPFRKANYTRSGQAKSTLDETDDFIASRLETLGYLVERTPHQAQAFRCNREKPLHHWYDTPHPDDPWHTVYNLIARKMGVTRPEEIVVVVSHKDSPSWYNSPGAYDNASGTIANLEIARLLKDAPTERSVWFLWCNEEHTPWTSAAFANAARERGDNLAAIFNLDALGGKSSAAVEAGRRTNVTRCSTPEGERLAELMAWVNQAYQIGLEQSTYAWNDTGDDDGSFINAGFPAAVLNIGSLPYEDPNYHMEGDTPENVDLDNVFLAAQASLAAVLHAASVRG